MIRMILTLLLCLGLPALATADTPTWEQHPTKNKPRKNVMVQSTHTRTVAPHISGSI